MDKSKSKLTNVTIGLAIIIGSFIYNALSGIPQLPMAVNWIVTVIVSVTIHQIIFWFLNKIIEHSDLLLKLFWGKLYIKGFWSYTYIVDGEKNMGHGVLIKIWILLLSKDLVCQGMAVEDRMFNP